MVNENIPVVMNSKEGILWKDYAKMFKEKIENDKVQEELDRVCLKYCESKVKEDSEKIEKDLTSPDDKNSK